MNMNHRKIGFTAAVFLVLVFALGYFLFQEIEEEPLEGFLSASKREASGPLKTVSVDSRDLEKKLPSDRSKPPASAGPAGGATAPEDRPVLSLGQRPVTEAMDLPPRVREIKEKIYALNIESTQQIPLLDDLARTGEADTREFWGDDWRNIDDWKKNKNGFRLDKNKDGTLTFIPDEKTAREYSFFENPLAYAYDAEHKEFVNEVDYYGKTIYNVAKFMDHDVLAMMVISGQKVDLTLFYKNAPLN